ncbi:hypothetical protein AMATHDRAFT_136525 [Amanita thiersii Skay4041]|uniref:NudC domain-containing protein 1 n=1 Tax=Amanita thiersii Skay4041 TaxID=703135 RepID=A0A2A9NWZ5_9AGAR|nr:hypothetical protein AMATHDRAFT_136525 [Amanita thiersii Skay4041]
MEALPVRRSLINSKFEGYKLQVLPQDDAVARCSLLYKPTQVATSGRVPLTFHEVQSRISHNHLTISNLSGQAVYLDDQHRVILVNLSDGPAFRVLYELPRHIQTAPSLAHKEYPSAAFFGSDIVFVADGHSFLYVLRIEDDRAALLGSFTTTPGSLEVPFRLHSVHQIAQESVVIILSSRYYDPNLPESQWSKSNTVKFDVWGIRVDLSSLQPNGALPLPVIWQRRGQDVPIYTYYSPVLESFLLIGGSTYRILTSPASPSYEPTSDEYALVPRADENLYAESQESTKPQPYSWTQTPDSVIVAFPLPSNTSKFNIKVLFSSKMLTLQVDTDAVVHPAVPIPHYSAKLLWDGILPSTSFWTWDREAEHSFGLLTLHLDKLNEGTRWVQVFSSAGTASSNTIEDIEVPETLDPSELWHIREALEKYTAALQSGGLSGLELGTGIPSLAEGEMDEEVDSSVGRHAYQTWLTVDGRVPDWWSNAREIPFQLLSTPLPCLVDNTLTLVIKSHVDGAVFSLVDMVSSPKWEHTSTFSALAFVLASKRDTRFTHHYNKAVLAFEGGAKDRGGNLYIYHAAPLTEKWAKQAVLKVDDGRGGSLLGVGAWGSPQGLVFVCLTEGELVMIKGS